MSVEELITDMSINDPSEIQEFNNIWEEYQQEHKREEQSESKQEEFSDESVMFGDDIVFEDDDHEYSDIVFMENSGSDKN